MLKNYIAITLRGLWKNKSFSFINIAGLAIGLSACVLIVQYVSFELSFDYFHKNIDDLYRVVNDRYQEGKRVQHSAMTYSGIGRALKEEFAEVSAFTRVEPYRVEVISYQEKRIGDQRAIAVDNSFLSMFSYEFLAGDKNTALIQPNSIVLSETLAKKIFDIRNDDLQTVVGRLIVFDRDSVPYKITGICRDAPLNSYMRFDLLMSYLSLYSKQGNNRWARADYDFTEPDFWQYIQLKHGTDQQSLEARLPSFCNKYFPKAKASGAEEKLFLQRVTREHLYSDLEYEIGNTGSITTVLSLLVIAIFILAIAWVNYINLVTSRSIERAREIGVRKVAGATRRQLIAQFLCETILVNLFALLIALLLINLLQPAFNRLLGQPQLSLSWFFARGLFGYRIIFGLILFMVAGIFISGYYPALVLSSFKPVEVLKGKIAKTGPGVFLRKGLVIGQFVIAIVLIIGSITVFRQVRFMNTWYLGYNMDQMLILRRPVLSNSDSAFAGKADAFVRELGKLAHVKGAAVSGRIPGEELGRANDVHRTDAHSDSRFTVSNMGVDHHFIGLYEMKLVSGRNFSPEDYDFDLSKIHRVIINESAAGMLGFKNNADAIGQSIMMFNHKWDVIGVVEDFNQKSLRYAVEPTVMLPSLQGTYSLFSVKVDPRELASTIGGIQKIYSEFFPGNLFDYYFLDSQFNKQYSNDQLFGRVFGLFAGLAIFIAGLGLFGLSLFSTAQRSKEIGIRKVLGASVPGLVVLLSEEFIKPVAIAMAIASPMAWFGMQAWLQNFAYRSDMSWWIFMFAGIFSIIVALITVSFQTIKTALLNPAKSLRTQ